MTGFKLRTCGVGSETVLPIVFDLLNMFSMQISRRYLKTILQLPILIWGHSSVTRWPRIFWNIWPLSTMQISLFSWKNSQGMLKTMPNFILIFTNCQKLETFCQRGEISANLVTIGAWSWRAQKVPVVYIRLQCDQLGLFLKGIFSNFLTKVAQISVEFWEYLKNVTIHVKTAGSTFWGNFCE